LSGDVVIHPELALHFLTGLVTLCSPPLCLWGAHRSAPRGAPQFFFSRPPLGSPFPSRPRRLLDAALPPACCGPAVSIGGPAAAPDGPAASPDGRAASPAGPAAAPDGPTALT
ncbi:unnamed protein product, partial [Closterium sp. NIES-53]